MKHTAQSIAARLNGVEIGEEDKDQSIITDAREAGLLIVFGYSDDCIEFRGVLNDEAYGKRIYFTREGKFPNMEDVKEWVADLRDALGVTVQLPELLEIEAIWDKPAPDGRHPSWHFKTTLPHATFDVMEDGNLFCIGMVVDLNLSPAEPVLGTAPVSSEKSEGGKISPETERAASLGEAAAGGALSHLDALKLLYSWVQNWDMPFASDDEWIEDAAKIRATLVEGGAQ